MISLLWSWSAAPTEIWRQRFDPGQTRGSLRKITLLYPPYVEVHTRPEDAKWPSMNYPFFTRIYSFYRKRWILPHYLIT